MVAMAPTVTSHNHMSKVFHIGKNLFVIFLVFLSQPRSSYVGKTFDIMTDALKL